MNTYLNTRAVRTTWFAALTFVWTCLMTSGLFAQGITTGGISGFIRDQSGSPVSGATVTVVHEPSGTKSTGTTRANGQYSVTGLRTGGPYTVRATGPGGLNAEKSDIYLDVGAVADASFSLSTATAPAPVVQMEAFSVSTSRDLTFDAGKMGMSTTLDAAAISNVATVRNNVQDIAKMDTRVFVGSLDTGGQLSAQGQHFRMNSLLIDGVQATDTYGLNLNGFSSLNGPVPLEALESVSMQISPYDVRYSGFTGAVINMVVKSGTNSLHGEVYYKYTNDKLRAKNPLNGIKEKFDEKTYGLVVNGPILRDRLFFSFAYDKQERETTAPQATFVPDDAGIASINAIIARAKALGYDPGTLSGPSTNLTEQETYIGKLDWNISGNHRLSATYRRNYSTLSNFVDFVASTSTSLSNHWFDAPRNTDAYTAQFNSQWTPDFRTEATVSYSEYDGSPSNRGPAFPNVRVEGISGRRLDTGATIPSGYVIFGTEVSRQLNFITTNEKQVKLNGDYSFGNHTLTVGVEDIITEYANAFVQNTMGNYTFATPATWAAGAPPTFYQLQKAFPGFTINDAVADWTNNAYAGFVQDSWKPSQKLTVMGGLRYDYPYIKEKPPVARNFAQAGFRTESGRILTDNTTTNSGNATLAPRIGFTLDLDEKRRTQIRGGVGLFLARPPAVWQTNAYQNSGAVYNYQATAADLAQITFNPNPNTQTVPGSANPAPAINVTDKDLKMPSLWKANIAIDHELPFGGIVFSADYYHNIVEDGLNTEFLNYTVASDGSGNGRAPDGRIRYGTAATITASSSAVAGTPGRRRNAAFADIFYITNSSKGKARGFTLSLQRPMKNKWGWSASWTNGEATETSPFTSSTASSNYLNRATFNPNEDTASISNTSIRDNVVVSFVRQFEFVKKAPTTVSLTYFGRTGRPYSWVFYGDANGDGFTFNDLFYVPTGPDDPKVAWANTTQRDDFFKFVESSSLKNYKGTHPERNSERSPWIQTMDIKITQALPIFKNLRAEVFANLINFANLIDKDWGIQEEVLFSFRRAVASASYTATGNNGQGVWNYQFTPTTLNGVPVTADDTPISRWQAQLGMRLKF